MDSTVVTGLAIFTAVLWVWAIIAMLRLPSWAYQDAGTSKARWALLLVIAPFLPVMGLVLCIWFIFSTSTVVREEVDINEHVGFPGGPPQY